MKLTIEIEGKKDLTESSIRNIYNFITSQIIYGENSVALDFRKCQSRVLTIQIFQDLIGRLYAAFGSKTRQHLEVSYLDKNLLPILFEVINLNLNYYEENSKLKNQITEHYQKLTTVKKYYK